MKSVLFLLCSLFALTVSTPGIAQAKTSKRAQCVAKCKKARNICYKQAKSCTGRVKRWHACDKKCSIFKSTQMGNVCRAKCKETYRLEHKRCKSVPFKSRCKAVATTCLSKCK